MNTTPIAGETYNQLLARDPDAAAEKLAKGFLHLINNHIPGIYLTEEEFKTVMPLALAKMSEGGGSTDGEDEDTSETP